MGNKMYQRLITFVLFAGLILVGLWSPVGGIDDAYALQTDSSYESFPRSISVAQAAAKKGAGAFFLDVREPQEWTQIHIPGSVLIPLAQLQSRLDELPRDKEIVVVCRSGNRSLMGLDIIRQGGLAKSSSMEGGLIAWQTSGYPAESGL